MLEERDTDLERRVLVCAPLGRDAQLIVKMLREHGNCATALPNLNELSRELANGAGAVVLTEESLYGSITALSDALKSQGTWSDLPIIILTTGGETHGESTWDLIRRLDPVGNVSLLERPLRTMTLISAVHVALRARQRQYQTRALHEELEQRVAERTAELERLNREAEGFSYTIAHDLRTPLRAIISTSHILLEDFAPKLDEDAMEQLKRQVHAATRMATLIDDLLRLSKLSREQMTARDFDFSAVAKDIANELSANAEAKQCVFTIQPGIVAHGDPLLIRFALLNLMQNACKFSSRGGAVEVGHEAGVYFVRDEGIGFEQQYADRMFRPFERLVNDSQFPGTGIGLANVKRIIDRHGGRIWAQGELGKGATFSFTLGRGSAAN